MCLVCIVFIILEPWPAAVFSWSNFRLIDSIATWICVFSAYQTAALPLPSRYQLSIFLFSAGNVCRFFERWSISCEWRSRDHPRTQIQITCTRRDLFLALRSSAHAADNHMYTQVSPTITCTRKWVHLRTQMTITCTRMYSATAITCTHHYS